jgi:hypothetical protein
MSAFGLRQAMFGILTLLPVLSCSGAPRQTAEKASPTAEQTATVKSALFGPLPYYFVSQYSSGVSQTQMISKNRGYCFLTNIAGAFTSESDWVRVQVGDDGNWYLQASSDGVADSSGNVGTQAAALCIGWNAFNGSVVGQLMDSAWFSSTSGTAPQPNPVCNLSGIGGDWSASEEEASFGGTDQYFGTTLGPPAFAVGTCTSRTTPQGATKQCPPCLGTEQCGDPPDYTIVDNTYVCMIVGLKRISTDSSEIYAELDYDPSSGWYAYANANTQFTFNCIPLP